MRIRVAAVAVLGCFINLSPAFAGDAGSEWRFRDVLQLIKASEAQGKPFQSPDELLAAMPADSKQWFTFMHRSNAKFQDASPQFPRAIVYNKNFVFAFNGNPSQRGYNTIEFMELDEKNKRIELREIEFVKTAQGVEVHAPDETPVKCLQCHGVNPRPIWHEYSDWEGAYGSDDDTLPGKQKDDFIAFTKSVKENPKSRYALLTAPPGFTEGDYYSIQDHRKRINLAFTKVLVRFNTTRALGIAQASPYYEKVKYILPLATGRLSGCSDNERGLTKFSDNLAQILKARGEKDPGSLFPRLMRVLDLPPARFNPQTGAENYTWGDGSTDLLSLFADLSVRSLAENDPAVAKSLSINSTYYKGEYPRFALYRWIDSAYGRVSVKDCQYLEQKAESDAQVTLPLPPPVPPSQTFEAQLKRAEAVRVNAAIPIACVYCHTVANDGPRFAFDDEAGLRKELKADNGRLLQRLQERAHPTAGTNLAMPPVSSKQFSRLSQTEFDEFAGYLKKLHAGQPTARPVTYRRYSERW